MDLLVTLDQNYLGPLRVLLGSLFLNDPGEEFHIYMIEEGLTGAQVEELSQLCRAHHSQLHPLEVPDGLVHGRTGGAVLLPGHVLPPSGGRAAAP